MVKRGGLGVTSPARDSWGDGVRGRQGSGSHQKNSMCAATWLLVYRFPQAPSTSPQNTRARMPEVFRIYTHTGALL